MSTVGTAAEEGMLGVVRYETPTGDTEWSPGRFRAGRTCLDSDKLRRNPHREEAVMPKYLIQASYNAEGVRGLLKDGGSKRKQAADELIKSLGGKTEGFYFAFGDNDALVIVDAPDNVSVAAASLAVSASGLVTTKTTVLLTPEEIDQAAKKSAKYSPPGK
jgi:uncharacterized protein with GYD domain